VFTKNLALWQKVEEVYRLFAEAPRGTCVAYADIEQAAGLERSDPNWGYLTRQLKHLVRQRRRAELVCRRAYGYELATVTTQLHELPRQHIRRAQRQLDRGYQSLALLSANELSPEQQRFRAQAEQRFATTLGHGVVLERSFQILDQATHADRYSGWRPNPATVA
jgi:hypothetical protein